MGVKSPPDEPLSDVCQRIHEDLWERGECSIDDWVRVFGDPMGVTYMPVREADGTLTPDPFPHEAR